MSLVLGSREVAAGPTVGFQGESGPSPAAFVGKGKGYFSAYLKAEGGEKEEKSGEFCLDRSASEESSSIGAPESSSGEEEEEEVQSKFKGGLGCLDSLEESLPIKRGLSNHFSGKSKSFASFSDLTSQAAAKDLAKEENPFNKRRRILIACKSGWSRKGLYSALNTSLPLISLDETQEVSADDDEEKNPQQEASPPPPSRKFKPFQSPRSFSLTDLSNT